MSVSRELVMRYFDGEVSGEEARQVEAALEQEPALMVELESYSEVAKHVRTWSAGRAQGSFDVSESVMRAIEPRQARVHSLMPRIATWLSLGAAVAAGSMLVVRSWSSAHVSGARQQPPPAFVAAEQPLSSASAAAPEVSAALEEEPKLPPATIESVDFGTNSGTVFVVSTDSSETPVVWMPEEAESDEDKQDRAESL